MQHWRRKGVFLAGLSAWAAACDDGSAGGGKGTLRLVVSAEETITDGLDKGTGEENTEDYSVRFDKYLAVVGQFELEQTRSGKRARLDESYVLNLIETGEEGYELGQLTLASGVWDKFSFRTPKADADTAAGPNVSAAERDAMVEGGLTYWIEGRVLREASAGGPVKFRIRASVPTQFSECSYEGEPGASVVQDGTGTATVTLHGDHIFFNGFPAANEQSVRRLASWLIASDLDKNGEVDNEELQQVDATDLFTQARGYSLSGAPIDIVSAFDFVRAQLASQGHFRGEGECLWEIEE